MRLRATAVHSVLLGQTDLRSSRLGFGCASVGGRVSERQSLRALAAAYERGVTFYDTARSYGYGDSERIVGTFLRGRRDRVLIATKCGIDAGASSLVKRSVKALVRPIFDATPRIRQAMVGLLGRQHVVQRLDVARLRLSVETSLRQLQTDYIDLLFLHACPLEALDQPEIFDFLETLKRRGLVRHHGVSSSIEVVDRYLSATQLPGTVVQYAHNLLSASPETALTRRADVIGIGNQPFGGVQMFPTLRTRLHEFAKALPRADALKDKLTPLSARVIAELALHGVLRDTRTQVAVCSMLKPEHVAANTAAVDSTRFSDEDIARVRAACRTTAPSGVMQSFDGKEM